MTAYYHLKLYGASGADNNIFYTKGGRGARVQGSVHLQKGTQLTVLVGQLGKGGGGGGGTFVVFANYGSPLAVAAGGGAAEFTDGHPGQSGKSGSINAGQLGEGGMVCVSKASFATPVGVGGEGGLVTDGRCFTARLCKAPIVASLRSLAVTSHVLRTTKANRLTLEEKEATSRKRRVDRDVKGDSAAVGTVG